MTSTERRITMTSDSNACTKCNGTGNLGYRLANGVCFRCNGFGFIAKKNADADASIASIRARSASSYESSAKPIEESEADENWLEKLYA